jgi:uncharacterized protein (TIGR03000 family)
MSRRWFYSASILAVTVVMLAADASQAQRLFGRRNRTYDNGNYYYNGPMVPGDGTIMAPNMQGGERRSFYAGPESMQGTAAEMPVYLDVWLPASASVTIEGEKTKQSGSRRLFVSPPVATGHDYVYDLIAKWMVDGREIVRTSKVRVRPGETVVVDLRPVPQSQQRAPLMRRRA